MLQSGKGVDEFIKAEDLVGVSEDEIINFCKAAIEANPKAAEDIKAGKGKAINALKGFVMKQSRGKADAAKVEDLILGLLNE